MSVFEDLWDGIVSIPGAVVDVSEDVVEVVGDVVEAVAGAAADAVSKVWEVLTESPHCLLFVGSTAYWQLVSELTVLRKTGAIKAGQRDATLEKIVAICPAIQAIPGYEMFWNCAWKVAFSEAGVPATIATTGGNRLAPPSSQAAVAGRPDQLAGEGNGGA